MDIRSKLPHAGTNIFSVMSALASEHEAINLSQGFPNFDCDPRLKDLVEKHMRAGNNQYAPMPGIPALRDLLAQKALHLYGREVDPVTEVTITAGATQAIYTAIACAIHRGDEVIIFDPAYDCYAPSVQSFGGVVVPIALRAPDFRIDWRAVQEKITDRTAMIIVNTPHNPLGRVLTTDDMAELERIAVRHDLLVLSDEVYEHIIFDGLEHASVLRFPGLAERAFVTYSFGKLCHTTGWKVGYCIAPGHLMSEFRKIHQFNVFSVNTPMQLALADYLQDSSVYTHLPAFFQKKRDFFIDALQDSAFSVLPCEGSYFILADYRRISDDDDMTFAKHMTTEHGVACIPLSPFYADEVVQTVVRFCFAKTESLLTEAAQKLCSVPVMSV